MIKIFTNNTTTAEYAIEVKGLDKSFKLTAKQQKIEKTKRKTVHAADNISFTVKKGEIYGLLGPNGAGKTTTLRMLATLIKPDSGDAFIDGVSIVSDPAKVREKIGFLTSELKLEDFFSVDYMFNFFAELHGMTAEQISERKQNLFESFGINDFAQVKVGSLSTGMKQKASLVVALAHDPDIIIFDEPTNGLDVITAKVVTDFLVQLKENGKTVILSTHIFSLVEKLCDRVGIIINGKMITENDLETLCAEKTLEERFFEIYEAEVQAK